MLNGIGRYSVVANRNGGTEIQAALNNQSTFANGGLGSGASVTAAAVNGIYDKDVLEGFINTKDENILRRTFRDMYEHDSISGATVDLISGLPFSDFTLSGLPNQEMLITFAKSLEAINIKTLLPEESHEYLVIGCFIASMNYDSDRKMLTSIMPHNRDWVRIEPLPIYGRDPVMDLQVPPEIVKQLKSPDPRIREAFDKWGPEWKTISKNKTFPLQPDRTLYIARKTFSTTSLGTSLYNRILPLWIMEKALMRGTIELAYRRQRSLLHLIIGDEDWEPTNNELQQYVQAFLQADVDPVGGVLGTRPGIQPNEIRQGGDFWRYDSMYDFFASAKFRGLGVSDTLLSSDTTFNNMETSLSIFLDQLRAYRDLTARKIFYERIFPLLAVENNYRREESRIVTTGSFGITEKKFKNSRSDFSTVIGGSPKLINRYHVDSSNRHSMQVLADDNESFDATQYYMPKIQWHKSLKPEADAAYLEMLGTLSGIGLPIPLRIWAAAGGQSITELMGSLKEDAKLRGKVARYQDSLPKSPQDQANEMMQQSQASVKGGILNRDYSDIEMRDSKSHKVLSRKGRSVQEERIHKNAAAALANLARRDNLQNQSQAKDARKRLYSYFNKSPIFGRLDKEV